MFLGIEVNQPAMEEFSIQLPRDRGLPVWPIPCRIREPFARGGPDRHAQDGVVHRGAAFAIRRVWIRAPFKEQTLHRVAIHGAHAVAKVERGPALGIPQIDLRPGHQERIRRGHEASTRREVQQARAGRGWQGRGDAGEGCGGVSMEDAEPGHVQEIKRSLALRLAWRVGLRVRVKG